MSIDLSKIANQLTTFSKSPSARRANEYSLKNAFMYQEMQEEQARKEDEAFVNTTNFIQNIENTAYKMAWRDKDKAVLQENYKEHADELKRVILEDYGGDITRFYQQGGKSHLQMFAMNVLNSDKAQTMAKNTSEFAKYIDAMNTGGEDGKNIFHTTHERALQYQRGDIDEFSYGIDMIGYNKPTSEHIKSMPPNMSKAEIWLNYGSNYQNAMFNYRAEKNKSFEEMQEVSHDDLIKYVSSYVGTYGQDGRRRPQGDAKLSNEISTVMSSIGNVNASDVNVLENMDVNYRKKLSALSELAFYDGSKELEGNIYGKTIFNDYLVELAGAFIEPEFTRSNGFDENGTLILGEVDHSGGAMYDVVGNKIPQGQNFDEPMHMMGAIMGYKVVGGDDRILTHQEMLEINDGSAGDVKVKPVMLMALQEERKFLGWGDENIVYKELDFDNVIKATAFNNALKADKDLLAAKVSENSQAYEQRIDTTPTFAGLKVSSEPKKLYNYALHYDRVLNEKIKNLGLQNADINTKSLLLSFAHKITQGNPENVIQQIDEIFDVTVNPDLNSALQRNDMQLFIQTYANSMMERDPEITQEMADEMLAEVTEFATAIRNSIIQTQKAK